MNRIVEVTCLAKSPFSENGEPCVVKKQFPTGTSRSLNVNWSADFIRKAYGFDAVGIIREQENSLILLGLESRESRNLDEFIGGHKELGNWCFSGIRKHFSPMVDNLLVDLEQMDPYARPVPAYSESFSVKELAVKTGMGVQGRNTLVINERSGGRLRFIIVTTSIEIKPTGTGLYERNKNKKCDKCHLCEIACPEQVLGEYSLLDKYQCIAYRQLTKRKPDLERCNICWKACSNDRDWAEKKAREKDKILRDMLPENANLPHQ